MATADLRTSQIEGGTWTIDTVHSLIEFSTRHFGIAYVKGRFRQFSGTVEVHEDDLLKSTVEITIDATKIETQAVLMREDLIRGEDILQVEQHPTITFRSTRIEQGDLTHYTVVGDLTMRGVTREVQIPL